ncbi:hypothetical protein GCM10023230_16260 [Flavobacterium hankyongi]|uniref:DUF2975 domain-containing protein n=2 Tax=Flavobacterium hankyongi TaxID=1176532 RepID=A0ABP8ZVZ6_9FLAO
MTKSRTKQILKVMNVVSWIIFIGLCVEAGSFIFNAVFSVCINPYAAHYFKLRELLDYDYGYFIVVLIFSCIAATLKAILFYLIVKVLHERKINIEAPFTEELIKYLSKMSYVILGIAIFSFWGQKYLGWIASKGIKMSDTELLRISGADVWFFMFITLYIIVLIFKRGVEMQFENELTI